MDVQEPHVPHHRLGRFHDLAMESFEDYARDCIEITEPSPTAEVPRRSSMSRANLHPFEKLGPDPSRKTIAPADRDANLSDLQEHERF
ncbi:hypothetical protein P12x_004654 [Tundrisphaera lichenicola]|uniref:hypothetical protein n=1 Tax=Tundrisphaera lichenicola TaxID=2029860 RepID=UPI003EBCDDDB